MSVSIRSYPDYRITKIPWRVIGRPVIPPIRENPSSLAVLATFLFPDQSLIWSVHSKIHEKIHEKRSGKTLGLAWDRLLHGASTQVQSHGQPDAQSGFGKRSRELARANLFSLIHSTWPSLNDWLWPAGSLDRSTCPRGTGPFLP